MRRYLTFLSVLFLTLAPLWAQGKLDGLEYKVELQAGLADGKTPLWLNANKYGLSSLEESNGYARAALIRRLGNDTLRRWGVGYGVDVAVPYHYTSKLVVHQAFAELRWLSGVLTVGAKEYPMELKNNELSSGSQTLGINARPVPQVRLALPEYYTLPFWGGWFHLKGHVAYGKMTDQNWQHDFTQRKSKYADNVLYHSKAGYLKIGNEERFLPWSLELGLEMAAEFGGTSHRFTSGKEEVLHGNTGLSAYWHAFVPGGGEVGETVYQNVEGNQLGSWLARINYEGDIWKFGLYVDKYFEDHSSLLMVDYDGYGEGSEWNVKKRHRYLIYDIKDMMLGLEVSSKYNRWLQSMVFEYLYTKYQSGPIYHDHNPGLSDHIGGVDNFYSHYIYTGWQHWGQVIGNPLYRSPIYNEDSNIEIYNNRFTAFHLGLSGNPTDNLHYRFMATYQDGLGSYAFPYKKHQHNVSLLLETAYRFTNPSLQGWAVKGAFGMDFGHILGDNMGFQLTITKTGLLTKHGGEK